MTILKPTLIVVGALLVAPWMTPSGASAASSPEKPRAVVELFTSQGCSSCPPADAFLGELSRRDDVIALSVHVDYWDYIGWKDLFALPQNTERQRDYQSRLNLRYVYTPQMVVHGTWQAVGSSRSEVQRQIEAAKKLPQIPVSLRPGGPGVMKVSIGTVAPARGEEAAVWFVAIDREHEVAIKRGENGGRTLKYFNVVRDFKRIATWRGEALDLNVPIPARGTPGGDGCAVLVQSLKTGHILGAGFMTAEAW